MPKFRTKYYGENTIGIKFCKINKNKPSIRPKKNFFYHFVKYSVCQFHFFVN